jgi:hypothetical protein
MNAELSDSRQLQASPLQARSERTLDARAIWEGVQYALAVLALVGVIALLAAMPE